MRSMSLVVNLIDLVTKHKSGELRCPATALIMRYVHEETILVLLFNEITVYTVKDDCFVCLL